MKLTEANNYINEIAKILIESRIADSVKNLSEKDMWELIFYLWTLTEAEVGIKQDQVMNSIDLSFEDKETVII